MFPVSVCKGCGRTIESKFVFCPWCGQSKVSYENQDSMEILFDKLEEMQKDTHRKKIIKMEQELAILEKELSILVLSAEMHK